MADEFHEETCNEKHKSVDDRLTKVEKAIIALQTRLPLWATLIITILSSGVTGLSVAILLR